MTTDAPRAYPLAWPAHRPRTPAHKRIRAPFQERGSRGGFEKISVASAIGRLEKEVAALRGQYLLLSTDLLIGPRGGVHNAAVDPGAAAYFHVAGKPYVLACDKYPDTAQNIAALAAHIKATRDIERHGVATAVETLHAFQALPPPAAEKPKRHWSDVFGVMPERASAADVRALFKVKAMSAHPDKGGSAEAMSELNVALTEALKEIA